jgi:hypothetical protein
MQYRMPASAASTLRLFEVYIPGASPSLLPEPLASALRAAPPCFFANKDATLSLSLDDFDHVQEHVVYEAIRSAAASDLRVRVEISAGGLVLDGSMGYLLREASHVTHVDASGVRMGALVRMEGSVTVDARAFPALRDLRLHVAAPSMAQLLRRLPNPTDLHHVTKLAILVHGCTLAAAVNGLPSIAATLCNMYWDAGVHNICISMPWDGAALPYTEWRSSSSQLWSYDETRPHPLRRRVRFCVRFA